MRQDRAQTLTADVPAVPATKPYYRNLYVGERGRVWVHRHVPATKVETTTEADPSRPPALTWREPTIFDVFESDGSYLGEVRVPSGMSVQVFRGDTVWGTRRGQFGEQYLVRATISPVESGAA